MLNKTMSKHEDKTERTAYLAGAQLQRNAIKRLGIKREVTNKKEGGSIDFENSLANTCIPSDPLAAEALNKGGGTDGSEEEHEVTVEKDQKVMDLKDSLVGPLPTLFSL